MSASGKLKRLYEFFWLLSLQEVIKRGQIPVVNIPAHAGSPPKHICSNFWNSIAKKIGGRFGGGFMSGMGTGGGGIPGEDGVGMKNL